MAPLLLKIRVVKASVTKSVQFDKSVTVYDACQRVRTKVPEAAQLKQPDSYGLFRPNEDLSRGIWLQPGRTLEYYELKTGHTLEYRTKQRPLRVRTLDGAVKTLLVDDSQTVFEITRAVCARIGLHNFQEFSFTVDDESSQWTLRRHAQHEHDKQLEALRREQHTHDKLNWLEPQQTLREQGLVDETTVVTLRKRFFFSDQNVNANDPVQLRLLYEQCHEAVVGGTHPVTKDESTQLAALQCQVLFGDFKEERFERKGSLKPILKDLLPQEYRKDKAIEQLIFLEHRKLFGLTELNAKFRYVELCRSLQTYGVSFFAVKEKVPGRNKLRPVLLGINREGVMRLDTKTKAVLQTWPLTTILNYPTTASSFSLDFGAYAERPYTVKTSEGEAMKQLLDGYIDLILQTKKAATFQLPEEIQLPTEESYVGPGKSTMIKITPGGPMSGEEGEVAPTPGEAHTAPAKEEPPAVQKELEATITKTLESITKSSELLSTVAELPSLGPNKTSGKWKRTKVEVSRHSLEASVIALLAASSSVVLQSCTAPQDTDYSTIGAAVASIGMAVTGATDSSRLLAALSLGEEDRSRILDASRALAEAMAALLNASRPENYNKNVDQLEVAAGDVAASSTTLLRIVEAISGEGKTPEAAGSLAKKISSTVAVLMAEARKLEASCDEPTLKNEIILSLKNMESSLQAFSLSVLLLSPHADSPLCQERLMEACRALAASIEQLCLSAKAITEDTSALRDLGGAAATVTEALTAFLQWIREGSQLRRKEKLEEAYEALLAEAGALQAPITDRKDLLKHAKALVEATKLLMHALKSQADKDDHDSRRRLLNAIKELASATSKMAQLAKGVATSQDRAAIGELRKEAEHMVAMATSIVAPSLRQVAVRRLQASSKQATSAAVLLVKTCHEAAESISSEPTQSSLLKQCKLVSEQITALVQALQTSLRKPEDTQAEVELVNTSKAFITPTGLLVAAAKKAVPVVGEETVAVQLGNMAKYTATRLGELRSAVAKAAAFCGSLVIDSAIQNIQQLSKDLTHSREEAKEGHLHPLPGQSVESCSQELLAVFKTMESLKCQLLGAVADNNGSNAGFVAREMEENLEVMVEVVCRLAAVTENQETQDLLFESAVNVLSRCEALLSASKLHLEKKDTSEEQSGLLDAARALSDALKQLLNYLPGQIEYEKALKSLQDAARALDHEKLPDIGDANYSELEVKLTAAAAALIATLKELLAAAKGAPMEQRMAAVRGFTQAYQEFLRAGVALAAVCQKKDDQTKILSYLQSTSTSSSKLLLTAKLLSVDPTQGQGQLTAAARSLIDAMNKLLTFCSASRPVLKECKGALLDVQTAGTLLDNADEPISDLTFYRCIDTTDKNIKVLSDVLAMLSDQVASGDHEELAHSVLVVGGAVCEVVEAAAQASYLVGVADPTSTAAVPGLLDQDQVARAAHMISSTCQTLTDPASKQTEVMAAAATVSKLSTTVCGICKVAVTNTDNAQVKKELQRFVTRMTDSTATLLESIEKLGEEPSDKHRQTCSEATKPLLDAVEELTVFASPAKFTSTPAKISKEGQHTQQPIIEGGQVVVRTTMSLLTAIMDHVSNTEVQKLDEEGRAVFSQNAKTFLDGLQSLLNAIRDNCLGLKKLDEEGRAMFSQYAKTLLDALQTLLNAIRDNCPGLKECDAALAQLNSVHKQIDQASQMAMQHTLQENASSSLQGFLKQLIETVADIGEGVQPVATAAKVQVDRMGKQVTTLVCHFPLFAQAAIGAVSKIATSDLQHKLLDHSSTVVEAAVHLVTIAREVRGNPHNYDGHKKVDQCAKLLQEAVGELTEVAEDVCNKNRLVGGMVGELVRALGRLEERPEGEENDGTFAEHQTKVLQQCEAIASAAHDMVVKGSVTPDSLVALRRKLVSCYTNLVDGTQGAVTTMEDAEDHLESLYQAAQALGEVLLELLYSSAAVQVHPEDQSAHSELAQHANQVKTKVSQVVLLFQTCGVGTHTCLKALATIRKLVGDIETTTTLLSSTPALQLPAAEQGEGFGQYRDEILKAARAVTEATQNLVQSAKGPQGELAKAVSTALEALTSQAKLVKKGIHALPAQNLEGKLLLLNAVKDVAHTLEGVMEASTASSGRRDSHPSTQQLKTSTKHAEVAGAQLVKAVDSAASASGSGAQTLQNAIDYIGYILEDFDTQVPWLRKDPSYQDLVQSTRGLSFASAKAVFAGRLLHLEDIAVCASMGKSAISDLLVTGAALAWSAELEEDKAHILKATRDCAASFKSLLEHIQQLITEPTDKGKDQLPRLAEEVTDNIQELLEAAKELRDEPSSPDLSVEMNLPAAVTSINSAAEQISALHPPPTVMTDADTVDYNYEILEDVKKTAKACSTLVELVIAVHQGLMPLEDQRSQQDEEWSHSILAAAQGLASEASELCETSNMYVQCYTSEEKLTAAAQSVAKSMSQVLLVALSKMEAGSEHYQKIQLAAAAVKQCIDSIVTTAEEALLQIEDDPYALMQSPVASMDQFRPCLGRQDSEIIRIQEDMERTGKLLTKIQLEWM